MNLRNNVRKANIKAWKATPPAVIESPLQAIHREYPDFKDEKGNFAGHHRMYRIALTAAQKGDGARVKKIARSI